MSKSLSEYLAAKNYEGAIRLAKTHLSKKPDDVKVLAQLGFACFQLKRNEDAAKALLKVIELHPDDAIARYNCGLAFENAKRIPEAVALYRGAIEKRPDYVFPRNNLAELLSRNGEYQDAEIVCRNGLAFEPNAPELRCALGSVLNSMGRMKEALAEYDAVAALPPAPSKNPVEASGTGRETARINALLASLCVDDMSEEELFQRHRAWAKTVEKDQPRQLPPRQPLAGRRLKIGFVSADFRRHSVAFFLEPVMALLDKSKIEQFCYSDVEKEDSITERFRSIADHWRNTDGKSDAEVAKAIREDGLDILFDLSGHTTKRLTLFALKPAPIQISWIGYPATTGLSSIDYRITDAFADPEGSDRFHSEKLLRLPGHFLAFAPPDDAPPVSESPCARNGYTTFGSFNALRKFSPSCLRLWADVLKNVPNSRLVLKNEALINLGVRERVVSEFAANGVDRSRIECYGREKSFASHLGLYSKVDIALDTFPYNGTTTTCEAMWMGVPTVSLTGKGHRSRVGLSLLSAAGLQGLCAETPEGFVKIARALANQPERLAALKNALRNAMAASPLCDAKGFAEKLEKALFEIVSA